MILARTPLVLVIIVLLSVGVFASTGTAHTVNDTRDGNMWNGHHHMDDHRFDSHDAVGEGHMWSGSASGWMLLWSLAFIAIIAGLVYWLTRRETEDEGDRAMQLLREQYARGEIDNDEFEERRSKLRTE